MKACSVDLEQMTFNRIAENTSNLSFNEILIQHMSNIGNGNYIFDKQNYIYIYIY